MSRRYLAIFAGVAAITVASVACADAPPPYDPVKLKACGETLSRTAFETRGGKLALIHPADLSHFPAGFFCAGCWGMTGLHAVVTEDGAVNVTGADHTGWSDDGNWRWEVIVRRVAAIRFLPPQLDGQRVCVRFGLEWTMAAPDRLQPGYDE